MLKEGMLESSVSPWRNQFLVTSSKNDKKRMVIDYSDTIVGAFQRSINKILNEVLSDTFTFVDNVAICSKTQENFTGIL